MILTQRDVDAHAALDASIWRSHGGSLHVFDGDTFTCICVHSPRFEGWVGKRAVKSVRRVGHVGQWLQAFRNPRTGGVRRMGADCASLR